MKNLKALILATLLLVPLLFFAFVVIFGEQHFTLRTYLPEYNQAGEVVRTAKGDTVFSRVPDFQLTNLKGEVVTQQELAGNGLYVASFFNTNCSSVCRQVASQLMRVQETFENKPQVRIASFTIEPDPDSLEVLQKYATQYGAKPAQWLFLTGSREKIYRLASEGFSLPMAPKAPVYSGKVMLVDRVHHVRGIYDGTDTGEIDRLIMEINVLLDEYSKSK
ncbi:SCO family protein [Pontibacter sp. 172403-2]|uniref:SCO family protein n=1 Tax=Pontibacter rufus TaxID=2791028 RepID=UPI0018AFD85F|nr:SCO family protein [Pontibacter sp. 172403-2]MBF9253875.1 SCO family protein [Pontibacter sp. 172403-2]